MYTLSIDCGVFEHSITVTVRLRPSCSARCPDTFRITFRAQFLTRRICRPERLRQDDCLRAQECHRAMPYSECLFGLKNVVSLCVAKLKY